MTKGIRKGKKKNSAEIANAEKSDSCGILPFFVNQADKADQPAALFLCYA